MVGIPSKICYVIAFRMEGEIKVDHVALSYSPNREPNKRRPYRSVGSEIHPYPLRNQEKIKNSAIVFEVLTLEDAHTPLGLTAIPNSTFTASENPWKISIHTRSCSSVSPFVGTDGGGN